MLLSEQVSELGREIRDLKVQLKSEGLSGQAINRHTIVVAKVAELQKLKSQLDADDPATDGAFFAKQRAEAEERKRQENALREAQQAELQQAEARISPPLVQRKIFHVFQYAGNGESFHYQPPPRLNESQTGFGNGLHPNPAVYITEKWDGTTMQATCRGIFQRLDLVGKAKKNAADRYGIRLIAWRDDATWRGLDFMHADARYAEALRAHLPTFAALPEDTCIYFELIHTDVNATFKHLPGLADIRVFDSAQQKRGDNPTWRFLPFRETVTLASRLGLPLVGWELRERLDAEELWSELQAASDRHYATVPADLEGFVIREAEPEDSDQGQGGGRIAKARVECLRKSCELATRGVAESRLGERPPTPTSGSQLSFWSADISLGYLAEIGLPLVRAT